jgi:hypothetical protein
MKNLNKGSWKVSKHTDFGQKNIFDEWRFFHGFDTTKPIVNKSQKKSHFISSNQILFSSFFSPL